jgi:3-isopropylmalate/(R)-2-methylmalate dehydratase small subunit
MEPFRILTAVACPLPVSGIDTDQLIPARFMSRSRQEGYGPVLLHDMRFDESGAPRRDCPLNDPARAGARILAARRNFGGGSSRESAVYALVDYGIRCVVAPSFGDIFAGNAANNGLVPARVGEDEAERLLALLADGLSTLTVDLQAETIAAGPWTLPFAIDPVFRTKLLNGWDDLDLTLSHADAVAAFAEADRRRRPWMAPTA